jgi:cytochrome c oxidase cbb3-type subunit IV
MDIDVNTLRSAVTLVSLVIFVGICTWAWSRKNRAAFEDAAGLPFDSE